jgi:hypothetical protein
LGEYPLISGKPTIFFENEGHWRLTETGELAADASVRVKTFAELETEIENAQANGLPDRSKQIAKLIEASSPYPGESAKKIVEKVFEDFTGPSGPSHLVDKSKIKEVPWELVAGREPFLD